MESGRVATPFECISTLYNNAFLFAPLFGAFYRALGFKERSCVLAYIVLPLVLRPLPRLKLARTSSLRTFTGDPERMFGLPAQIALRRRITNLSLQHCFDTEDLILGEDLSIAATGSSISPASCPKDMLKAATKLGEICAPHSPPAIYLQLGIKRL